jgi:hypothetical protein
MVCADQVSSTAFDMLRSMPPQNGAQSQDVLPFEVFAELYNAGLNLAGGGFLELLAVDKWESLVAQLPDSSDATAAEHGEEGEVPPAPAVPGQTQGPSSNEPAALEEGDVLLYRVPLPGSAVLLLGLNDMKHLSSVLSNIGLEGTDPGAVYAAFDSGSDGGILDKQAFNRAARSLLPHFSDSDYDTRLLISCALSSLFFGFATGGGSTRAEASHVACAVATLTHASKLAQLQEAWTHFDADGDGLLSFGELAALLSCFLTAVLVLTRSSPPGSNGLVVLDRNLVRRTAASSARSVFAGAGLESSALVGFGDVCGASVIEAGSDAPPPLAWLELVDLAKCVRIALPTVPSAALAAAPQPAADVADAPGESPSAAASETAISTGV